MPFPTELREAVRRVQGNRCDFCGVVARLLDVHHKVPSRDGGLNTLDNAAGLCPVCHDMFDGEQKGGLTYEQARERLSAYAHYLETDKT